MRKKTIVGTILVIFILSGSIFAQEKEGQKIELPQLTLEQKWGRSVMNLTVMNIASIAYAKSKGETPGDMGKFVGELVSPSWEGVKGMKPFIRAMYRNWQMFKNFQMEILSESETSFIAKIKGFGEGFVKAQENYGVTVEEYLQFFEQIGAAISKSIGLEYKQKVEGDWVIITVTEKK